MSFSFKIVDKALEEPKYSQLYAQLCLRLSEDAPNFEDPSAESQAAQKQNTVRLFANRICTSVSSHIVSYWYSPSGFLTHVLL